MAGLCPGASLSERPPQTDTPHTLKSGRYASYWIAFLLIIKCAQQADFIILSPLNKTIITPVHELHQITNSIGHKS